MPTYHLTADEARLLAWAAKSWAWHCHDRTPGMPPLDQSYAGPGTRLFGECRLLLALSKRLTADLDQPPAPPDNA